VVAQLVEYGCDINATDCNGETAFHWAAVAGNSNIIDAIKETLPLLDAKSVAGFTPLMKAAQMGHVAVVQSLIDAGACIYTRDNKYGWTALHLAAVDGREQVCEALIKAGASTTDKDNGRCTALQIAASPELRLLMSRCAAEIEMGRICARGGTPYL